MLGDAGTDRSARPSARPRLSREGDDRERAARGGGGRLHRVAAMANTSPVNDNPEITRYMLDAGAAGAAARLVPVSAVTRGLRGRETGRLRRDGRRPVRGCSPTTAFRSMTRPCWRSALRRGRAARLRDFAARGRPHAYRLRRGQRGRGRRAPRGRRGFRRRRRPRDPARPRAAIGAGAAVHIAHISTARIAGTRARGAQRRR